MQQDYTTDPEFEIPLYMQSTFYKLKFLKVLTSK